MTSHPLRPPLPLPSPPLQEAAVRCLSHLVGEETGLLSARFLESDGLPLLFQRVIASEQATRKCTQEALSTLLQILKGPSHAQAANLLIAPEYIDAILPRTTPSHPCPTPLTSPYDDVARDDVAL